MLSRKIGLDHIAKFIPDKKVLMRVDFNVPIKSGQVQDPKRISAAVPSIKKVLENRPKCLVLASHLGRPDGQKLEKYSLKPLVSKLEELLSRKVTFLEDCVGRQVEERVNNSTGGEVILLENLRFHIEEEGKAVDEKGNKIKADPTKVKEFRASLSKLGDLFVNDAFGTAHRAHSSMVGVNHQIRAAGYLMKKELDAFSQAIQNPKRPYLVVQGGAKIRDKIQLMHNLLEKVDEMLIGGGMSYTFLKQIHGINIGASIFDKEGFEMVESIMEKAKQKGVKMYFPLDIVCGNVKNGFKNVTEVNVFDLQTGIPDGWEGFDAGPLTRKRNTEVLNRAQTIVWNGPVGFFEDPRFRVGSATVMNDLMRLNQQGVTTICGGGDTASLISMHPGAEEQFTHVSTGGGASIELLEGKTLPGVDFLSNIEDLSK